jgi:hypothetical protein
LVALTKDPAKVRAGKASALKRWGELPRVVRLDELTMEQCRLVLALVDAAKDDAPTVSDASVEASEEASRVRGQTT